MHERVRLLPFLLLSLLLESAWPARATTVAPPANLGHLARLSTAVVFAQAIDSRVEEDAGLPYTVTRFQTLRLIAGADPGLIFEVREPGGSGKVRAAAVAGAPRYQADHNYLLFLDRAPAGGWRSKMMAYGLLEEVAGTGRLRPLPEAPRIEALTQKSYEPVGVYRKEALLDHLREVARGAAWNGRQVEAPQAEASALMAQDKDATGAAATAPAGCVFLIHEPDGLPIRWFGYETGDTTSRVVATTPGQAGIADGGVAAVQAGVAAWSSHPDAVIRLGYGGTRASRLACTGNFDYDDGAVTFNDPCGEVSDLSPTCSGTLAFGGAIYDPNTTLTYDGSSWHRAFSTFVIINNGTQCVGETSFREVVSHELGHTQGFGHHNPPNPATALMSANLKGDGLGAALRATDKVCADFAYHTFLDVPYNHLFWRQIEAIQNAGLTNGCAAGMYCPSTDVTRAEMAKFLELGLHGASFVPPAATGTVFTDVPASHWAAAWIEQLYRDGITKGCAAGRYCPDSPVLRSEMAGFLLRVRYGGNYVAPRATGTVFVDVPASYWAADNIEKLYADGLTNGCSAQPRAYCPEQSVTRDQMAGFLSKTFNLPLP